MDTSEELTALRKQIRRENAMLGNAGMTAADRILWVHLEREYPILLHGIQVKLLVGKLARDTGLTRQSSSVFLAAMRDAGAIAYEVKRSSTLVKNDGRSELAWEAESFVTETELCILSPERIITRTTPKRIAHVRKVSLARSCCVCGSTDIVYKVEPICRACGWRQPLEIVEFEDLR